FALYRARAHRHLPSFPTRRSSDLVGGPEVQQEGEAVEVPFDIRVARVPFLKCQLGRKLRLSGRLERDRDRRDPDLRAFRVKVARSEEHTSELQSPYDLVCRLLLEK